MSDGKRLSIGPKKTLDDLQASATTTTPGPGQPPQSRDGRMLYHHYLDGTWDNAKWAEGHDNTKPDSPYFGDRFFSREGHKENVELRKAISELFVKIKKLDPDNPQWLLAWRMYPNKDHERWGKEGFEGCGCNCGCYAPRGPYDK